MANHEENPQRVTFGSFDPTAEVEITERNLPHWYQPGAAVFITFRTADSMPWEVVLRWLHELEQWLASRSLPTILARSTVERTLPNHDQLLNELGATDRREFRRLSDRILHRSLDECHGACLLKRPDLAKIVGDAILFYQEKQTL